MLNDILEKCLGNFACLFWSFYKNSCYLYSSCQKRYAKGWTSGYKTCLLSTPHTISPSDTFLSYSNTGGSGNPPCPTWPRNVTSAQLGTNADKSCQASGNFANAANTLKLTSTKDGSACSSIQLQPNQITDSPSCGNPGSNPQKIETNRVNAS